jgi:hypothetical protein
MPTYPTSPALPAVTTATEVNPAFLNTFVDNINAIGDSLIALVGGVDDGNIDIDAAKGIKWGTVLKISFSGGDIILDDGVVISGGLDVGGTLTVDTITDSGAGAITFNEEIIIAAGKYIDSPEGRFDTIDDSGAAQITVNESLEMAAGKEIKGAGPAAVSLSTGVDVTGNGAISGNLDIAGTLTVDTINDSGGASIAVQEDLVLSAGKYIDAPTGKFDTIDDSGAVSISILEDFEFAAGKYIDAPTGKFDVIDDSGAAQIIINETLEMAAAKGIQGTGASALAVNAGMNVTGSVDITGTLTVDTINDSGGAAIAFSEHIEMAAGKDMTCQEAHINEIRGRTVGTIAVHDSFQLDAAETITIGTAPTYNVTNELVDRTYDANTVAIAELADVVGTMINDLISFGLFQ